MVPDDPLTRTAVIVVAAILLLPILMMILLMPMMGLLGWGHMWNGTGAAWMWLLMGLIPLLVFLGFGYLLYRAVRQPSAIGRDPALEELRVAYARGEISDEEFEERRKRLEDET